MLVHRRRRWPTIKTSLDHPMETGDLGRLAPVACDPSLQT